MSANAFRIEVDIAADNTWSEYARFTVQPGQRFRHVFPEGYSAHWVRLVSGADATATAQFTYGDSTPRFGEVKRLEDGTVRLSFMGAANQPYTLLGSTNVLLPPSAWQTLASGKFDSEPATFLDVDITNRTQRFYSVSTPLGL